MSEELKANPDIQIQEPRAQKYAQALSVYDHPEELKAALREAQAHFYRTLKKIDPTYPWKIQGQVIDNGFSFYSTPLTVSFHWPSIGYTREATDLVHPNTYITPEVSTLDLEYKTKVAHCCIRVTLNITSNLSDDEKITLRQCGAMREERDTYYAPQMRTVVQCEI